MMIHLKWASKLGGVYCVETDSVAQLRQRITSEPSIPPEHKQLVHKGLLLQDDMTLAGAGIVDGSTVHIIPNEQPFQVGNANPRNPGDEHPKKACGRGHCVRALCVCDHCQLDGAWACGCRSLKRLRSRSQISLTFCSNLLTPMPG